MRKLWLVGLALLGCRREAAPAMSTVVSPKAADALWALAPADMTTGMIATPRALQLLEGGVASLDGHVRSTPELAIVRSFLDEGFAKIGGPFTTLADLGLDRSRGFAVFNGPRGPVLIVPVGDRAKLHARFGLGTDAGPDKLGPLTCKTIAGAYACAVTAEELARLGTAKLPAALNQLDARGDIEVVAKEGPIDVAAVAQLERGALVIRGVTKAPPQITGQFGAARKPRADTGKTSAFAIASLGAVLRSLPPQPLAGDVSLADLGRSISGPVTVSIANGSLIPDVRIPLSDPVPARTLLAHCDELIPAPMRAPSQEPGVCRIVVPQYTMTLDIWVTDTELRLGSKAPISAPSVAMTAFGTELAGSEWSVGLWGRGTLLGTSGFVLPPDMPGNAQAMLRALALINELGLAVRFEGDSTTFVIGARSVWSNPPDVTAKILAIPEAELARGQSDTAVAIARTSPTSPFASDFAAGQGGLMVPTAAIGMLAAIAIPAFMDYTKKAKRTEASLQLNKLSKNAKVYYSINAELPKGEVALTPAESCCKSPGIKCVPTATTWASPVWQSLDFQIDEPHLFRYSYKSDGKTLTATAVGDLDCDGTEIAWTLSGTIVDGAPVLEITPPAPNSD
jgi:type II secretory pathway pseudopilin PulG